MELGPWLLQERTRARCYMSDLFDPTPSANPKGSMAVESGGRVPEEEPGNCSPQHQGYHVLHLSDISNHWAGGLGGWYILAFLRAWYFSGA